MKGKPEMTAVQFCSWLDEVKASGRAKTDAECGELLGLSRNSIVALKKNGSDRRMALACAAILAGIEPYK